MSLSSKHSFLEFFKVLAKYQQQRQKSQMKGGSSFASKYQAGPSVEEKCPTAKKGFGNIFYVEELEKRMQLTAISVLLGKLFDVSTDFCLQYQFHSESIIDNEKVELQKVLIRMMKLEDHSDHKNWQPPVANVNGSNGYELLSEYVIDMLKQLFQQLQTLAEKMTCLPVDNLNVSLVSDFLTPLTPENMNVASLALADTDEGDLFGDLVVFELPHYGVKHIVGEVKKIKVKAKLTLPSPFVVEGAQTVEDEEYEETIKEERELPAEPVPEMTELKADMRGVQEILESDVRLGVKRAAEDPPDDTGSRDPQDDDDIIMDEFCVLERFEKLRDQAARNRTSIEELGMKLKDPFVKVKDMTSPRDSRVIARGAVRTATWPEVAGRKQPPSLKVAKVRSPGTPPNGLSEETEEEVKTKEEMSSSPSSSCPPTADFTAQNCLRPIGTRWIYTNKGDTKNVAVFRHGDDFVVCGTRTRHAELLVHQLGLSRLCKEIISPLKQDVATLADNLKNIDKATQKMKTDRAKHDRLTKEKVQLNRRKNWERSQKKRTLSEKKFNQLDAVISIHSATMHFAVDKQSEKFVPHGNETTSLHQLDETSLKEFNVKDFKVRTDEKRNDLESYTFNVKECNAMIIEINDKKFYIIFVQCFDVDCKNVMAKMENSPISQCLYPHNYDMWFEYNKLEEDLTDAYDRTIAKSQSVYDTTMF